MRRTLPVLLAAALLAPVALAQHPRSSVQIDTTGTGLGVGPGIASSGNLSALVYNDGGTGGSNTVNFSISDGRGLIWSVPQRLDADTTGAVKHTGRRSVAIAGPSIYAAWTDERFGSTNDELYVNASHDGGATWVGESLIDKAYPTGTGVVRDWRMVVSAGSAGMDDVYFLVLVDPTGAANDELYLIASHDGGATFAAPVHVPQGYLPGVADVDSIALTASGSHVMVVWNDDRNGINDDVWFQQSLDGGATWLASDVPMKTNGLGVTDSDWDLNVAQSGSMIVVVWQEERTSTTNEELRANISTDMGATWLTSDLLIGGYTPGTHDVDSAEVAINNGIILIAEDDNRTGSDEIYLSESADGGATWNETQLSTSGGGFPRIVGSGDSLACTFSSGSFPNTADAAFSRDGGLTWSTGFTVSDHTGSDVDYSEMAFNSLYGNFLNTWLDDSLGVNHVFAGGFRPQTLTPAGTFSAGNLVSFDASNFPVSDEGGFFGVLASGGTGSYLLPFGDGRDIGLANDAFLAFSLANIPGLLSGSVGVGGSGSTASLPVPASLPVGTVVHFVAVAFRGGVGSVSLGAVTDIESVTIQ